MSVDPYRQPDASVNREGIERERADRLTLLMMIGVTIIICMRMAVSAAEWLGADRASACEQRAKEVPSR